MTDAPGAIADALSTPTPTPAPAPTPSPSPTPSPTPTPTLTPAPTDRWQDKWLPEDLRADETLATYKSPEDAFRGLVETRRWAKGRVPIPAAGDEAAFTEFASKIRPEKPEDYKLGDDKGQPTPLAEAFRKTFHDIGLHPVQAEKLNAAWNQQQADMVSKQQQAGKDALTAIELEFGPTGYNQRLEATEAMLRAAGLDDAKVAGFTTTLEQSFGAGDAMRVLMALAEKTGELGKIDGNAVALRMGAMSKDAAQAEINRQNSSTDPEFIRKITDPGSPEYAQRRKLMEVIAKG